MFNRKERKTYWSQRKKPISLQIYMFSIVQPHFKNIRRNHRLENRMAKSDWIDTILVSIECEIAMTSALSIAKSIFSCTSSGCHFGVFALWRVSIVFDTQATQNMRIFVCCYISYLWKFVCAGRECMATCHC